jgi:hypothetical protein
MSFLPPFFLRLAIGQDGKPGFRIWLPLFLLIPFIYLAIVLFNLFFVPLVLVFSVRGRRFSAARVALLEPFRILNATKGIRVDVQNPYHQVSISVR